MILKKIQTGIKYLLLNDVVRHWSVLNLISPRIKPAIVRFCGAKIGKNVRFGSGLYVDNNAGYLTIEDNVILAPNVTLLFHQRILKNYHKNDDYFKIEHTKSPIKIEKGAFIGIGATIMPGVTIGNGSIVGACSLVTKDVPSWVIVAGVPAKIVRVLEERK